MKYICIGGENHGKDVETCGSRYLEACYTLEQPILREGWMTSIGVETFEMRAYWINNKTFVFYVWKRLRPYSKRTIAKVKKFTEA